MIAVVSSTRGSNLDFWTRSLLGRSLERLKHDKRIRPLITYNNTSRGLSEVYNEALSLNFCDYFVFVHDDVWIEDFFFPDRIEEGLKTFNVIGIVGNRRRTPRQPCWCYTDDSSFQLESRDHLSGYMGHGKSPFGLLSYCGPSGVACETLDGLFLAARRNVLMTYGERPVLFDPRFDFHCYDLDFCRTARSAGLTLGTWPICVTHESDAAPGSEQWYRNWRKYLDKWGS